MKRYTKNIYGIVSVFSLLMLLYIFSAPQKISAQENKITLHFDFTAMEHKNIVAKVLLFNIERVSVDAGSIRSVQVEYADVYYLSYSYYEKSQPGKEIRVGALPLYLPPTIAEYTIIIPMLLQNPAGVAQVRFQNNFGDIVRLYATDADGTRGFIGSFDPSLPRDERNAAILPNQTADFTIPASRYKLEIINNRNQTIRQYEEFYFPASFKRYIIELDPVDTRKVSVSLGLSDGAALNTPLNLEQEFVLNFTKPMIPEIVEANINFFQTENTDTRHPNIPLSLQWEGEGDTRLKIKPYGFLLPDTEYSISLNLDMRDRRGNSLAKSEEWRFITNNVFRLLPRLETVTEKPTVSGMLAEWQHIKSADGYELRIFHSNDVVPAKDLGKSEKYEFERTFYPPSFEYIIVPYKILEGKKAYSASAIEQARNKIYMDGNIRPPDDIDWLVKNAVNDLVQRIQDKPEAVEVIIEPITINGSASMSRFSEVLYNKVKLYAVNHPNLKVVERKRGEPQSGIKGEYSIYGDTVDVTFTLVSASNKFSTYNDIVGITAFSISVSSLEAMGIAYLPGNLETMDEVNAQTSLFEGIPLGGTSGIPISLSQVSPPPLPVSASPNKPAGDNTGVAASFAKPAFFAEAWPNEESRTYYDGDKMTINLYASEDCYAKVYHIDVNNQMQLIFPNQTDRNNRLIANQTRTIPDNTSFVLHAPFGEENILAVFSPAQFENLEREMLYPAQQATRETISRAATTRGMTVQTPDNPVFSVRFTYTILPANLVEETFSYKSPSDIAGAVQALRDEVRSQGGSFTGNEREGTFSAGGMNGSYRVSAGEAVLVIRHLPHQSAVSASSTTRGSGGFSFSFDKPRDLSQAVQSVRSGIEKKGGSFTGDTNAGNFRASGIAGNYLVQDRVSVTIHEKPFIIPNQMIEKEVKNFFGLR
ncbi:MAG: DUF4384 domain-containing protein [Treponema sp.]|jgi:hypothetical protein|nr:DUF4384 domain-containing protein [Treponema sp.]